MVYARLMVLPMMLLLACEPEPLPEADVVLRGTAFNPDTLNVTVGTSVVWLHDDGGLPHTVTSGEVGAADGAFDSRGDEPSARLSSGETFEHTFLESGAFEYHCVVHRELMTGVIVVGS